MNLDYKAYLKSDWWLIKRQEILHFWNSECALCCKPAEEVHHRHYRSLQREKITDCIALCKECHKTHHLPLALKQSPLKMEYDRRLGQYYLDQELHNETKESWGEPLACLNRQQLDHEWEAIQAICKKIYGY